MYVLSLFLGYCPRLCFLHGICFLSFALFLLVGGLFSFCFVILVVLLDAGLLDL